MMFRPGGAAPVGRTLGYKGDVVDGKMLVVFWPAGSPVLAMALKMVELMIRP